MTTVALDNVVAVVAAIVVAAVGVVKQAYNSFHTATCADAGPNASTVVCG